MEAGKLNESIEIWSHVITVNEYGEETTVWEKTYSCRAQLMHIGGTKVVDNNEVVWTNNKTFHVRLHVPVTEEDRLKWNSKFYSITNIEPNREKQYLILQATLIND